MISWYKHVEKTNKSGGFMGARLGEYRIGQKPNGGRRGVGENQGDHRRESAPSPPVKEFSSSRVRIGCNFILVGRKSGVERRGSRENKFSVGEKKENERTQLWARRVRCQGKRKRGLANGLRRGRDIVCPEVDMRKEI